MEWIRQQLDAKGVSQGELGAAIGLTSVQVNKILTGYRRLESTEADKIRKFFGYRLPEEPSEPIPITGVIAAEGQYIEKDLGISMIRPSWIPEKHAAAGIMLSDNGGQFALLGDAVFFDKRAMMDPNSLVGRTVIARLQDGDMYLRLLGYGSKMNTFNLLPLDGRSKPFFDVIPAAIHRTWPPQPREEILDDNGEPLTPTRASANIDEAFSQLIRGTTNKIT